MPGMSMQEFLGHSTRGGRGNVLKDWKEKGSILVWLNRKAGLHCLWRHPYKRITTFKDKAPEVWSEKILCYHSTGTDEDNEILANQYRRDKETGARLFPPTCGICRFLEDVYQAVKVTKDVSWTDPAFVFKTAKAHEVMHAGGLLGFFKSQKMTDEEKAELQEHAIFQKDAWKEDLRAKAEYLFCIVDGNDPKSGLQVAIQTQTLGDKMKVEIGKQMKARGEKGDPTLNPYPFLWEYDEKANFDDAYTVTPMTEEKPSAAIQKLIDSNPPDVSNFTSHTPRKLVRTMMEQHCVLDVGGWEQYFPDVPEADSKDKKAEAPQERTPEVSTKKAELETTPAEEADMVACDDCGKAMLATATKCPHCGKVYEVETSAPPTPAPLKKRSEAKAAQASTPAPKTQATGPDMFGGEGSDVPF